MRTMFSVYKINNYESADRRQDVRMFNKLLWFITVDSDMDVVRGVGYMR